MNASYSVVLEAPNSLRESTTALSLSYKWQSQQPGWFPPAEQNGIFLYSFEQDQSSSVM